MHIYGVVDALRIRMCTMSVPQGLYLHRRIEEWRALNIHTLSRCRFCGHNVHTPVHTLSRCRFCGHTVHTAHDVETKVMLMIPSLLRCTRTPRGKTVVAHAKKCARAFARARQSRCIGTLRCPHGVAAILLQYRAVEPAHTVQVHSLTAIPNAARV